MDFDPDLLARLQFACKISFNIIFPSFTIGHAAYIATQQTKRLRNFSSATRSFASVSVASDSA